MKCSTLVLLVFFLSLSAGDLTPPQLSKTVSPHYPKHLKRQGIEGEVQLSLLIDESGNVETAQITQSLHSLLDTLSLKAAKQLKFIPGHVADEAVAVKLPYTFSFSLKPELEKLANVVRIQGTLIYKGSSQPIKSARVQYHPLEERLVDLPNNRVLEHLGNFNNQYIEEKRLTTKSDSLGRFYFYGIPQGKFELTAHSEDTHLYSIRDSLKESKKLKIDFILEPLDYNEYEVVTSYRAHNEISERGLSIEELGTVAGSAGDPVKAIQSLPGVARSASGNNLIFRGANPKDNLYYLDDIQIPYLYHDGGRRSVIPSQALSEIAFYPSAYGAKYGNGVGGVINAKTNLPRRKKISAMADINLIDMGFFFDAAPGDNVQFTVGGRISDRTGFTKRYMEELEGDNAIFPRYYDFFGKLRFTTFKNQTIDLVFLGANDSLVTPTNSEITAPQDYRSFNTIGFIWNWKISNTLTQLISYGYQFENYGFKRTVPYVNWIRHENSMRSNQFRSRWNWNPSHTVTLSGGINGDIRYTKLGLEKLSKITKEYEKQVVGGGTFGTLSPWTELQLTPRDPFTIRLGARYDYYAELQHSGTVYPAFSEGSGGSSGVSGELAVRLAMTYRFNDQNLVKMALGNYNQSPKPIAEAIDQERGDPTLPTTKAAHYTLGYEWNSGNYSVDIQGYFNNRWNIPYNLNSEIPTANENGVIIPGDSSYNWFSDGTGRSYGLELLIRRARTEHFTGWLSYTLSRGEEKNLQDYYPIDYDQTHNLQLLGNFFLPKLWEIGGKFHYTTGNPTTPASSFTDADMFDIQNPDHNSERLDPGIQLDLRIAKKIVSRKVTTEIYCDIQNLLCPLYKTPEYTEYDYATGEEVHFYTPIIPTLGVKVSF